MTAMASRAALRGQISKDGAIELLREIEAARITGTLAFRAVDGEGEGEVALIGGEIAVDQPKLEDGRDPVDVLLSLGAVDYEVHQRLPDLPVSRGGDLEKRGSLAVHVPVDLMSYCEHAGLTGVLELSHEGRKAEAFYQAGELTAIELDGSEISDLQEVFGWEQGRFRIRLDPEVHERFSQVPDEVELETGETSSYKGKGESTSKFLRVVEMALTDVLNESERARSPTRTSPPLPPPPRRRPRPTSVPAPRLKDRKDQTVRLIYLTGEGEDSGPSVSTRHAQRGGAEIAHIEARPERRAAQPELDPMAKKRKGAKKKPPPPRRSDEGEAPAAKAPAAAKPAKAEAKLAPAPKKPEAKPASKPASKPAKAEAKPASKPAKAEAKPASKPAPSPAAASGPMSGVLGAVVWAIGVLVLGLAILFFLAQLPPVG